MKIWITTTFICILSSQMISAVDKITPHEIITVSGLEKPDADGIYFAAWDLPYNNRLQYSKMNNMTFSDPAIKCPGGIWKIFDDAAYTPEDALQPSTTQFGWWIKRNHDNKYQFQFDKYHDVKIVGYTISDFFDNIDPLDEKWKNIDLLYNIFKVGKRYEDSHTKNEKNVEDTYNKASEVRAYYYEEIKRQVINEEKRKELEEKVQLLFDMFLDFYNAKKFEYWKNIPSSSSYEKKYLLTNVLQVESTSHHCKEEAEEKLNEWENHFDQALEDYANHTMEKLIFEKAIDQIKSIRTKYISDDSKHELPPRVLYVELDGRTSDPQCNEIPLTGQYELADIDKIYGDSIWKNNQTGLFISRFRVGEGTYRWKLTSKAILEPENHAEVGDECKICFQNFTEEMVSECKPQCANNHTDPICKSCLEKCITKDKRCPLCRKHFEKIRDDLPELDLPTNDSIKRYYPEVKKYIEKKIKWKNNSKQIIKCGWTIQK